MTEKRLPECGACTVERIDPAEPAYSYLAAVLNARLGFDHALCDKHREWMEHAMRLLVPGDSPYLVEDHAAELRDRPTEPAPPTVVCVVCGRELEPVRAVADGSPTLRGHHPCPDHPDAGSVLSGEEP